MLITAPRRLLVARDPVDFRKSIDGLAAVCEIVLREQPLDGTLFLFTNRSRDAVKRLERGTYQIPDAPPDVGQIAVDPAQLAMILEGIDLSARRRLRYRRRERSGDPAFNDRLPEGIDKTRRG